MGLSSTAAAADFYVTWGDDSHYDGVCDAICTFREAFEASRASSDNDVIHVMVDGVLKREGIDDTNVAGDLDLCKPEPGKLVVIEGDLRYLAWGPATQLQNRDRLIHVVDDSTAGCYPVDLIVVGLQMWGGYVEDQPIGGGAVRSDGGELTLLSNTLWGNYVINSSWSPSGPGGGAVESVGPLTIGLSTLYDNEVVRGDGGAVRALGDLLVGSSTIRDNMIFDQGDGGGIIAYGSESAVLLQGSHIRDNRSAREGGGVWSSAGKVELVDTEVFGNQASLRGGGIYLELPLEQGAAPLMNRSAVNENGSTTGGGLYVVGEATRTLTLQNSTISSNLGPTQAAMYLAGSGYTVELHHVTVARNLPVPDDPGHHIVTGELGTSFSYRASILEGTCFGDGSRWSDGYNVLFSGGSCPMGGLGDWGELSVPVSWLLPLSSTALGLPRFHDLDAHSSARNRVAIWGPCLPEDQAGDSRPHIDLQCSSGSREFGH